MACRTKLARHKALVAVTLNKKRHFLSVLTLDALGKLSVKTGCANIKLTVNTHAK